MKRVVGGVIAAVIALAMLVEMRTDRTNPGVAENSQPITQTDVRSYFVGVWTRPTANDGTTMWSKYEINADGTYRFFTAPAFADGWNSDPLTVGTWNVGQGKYADTGRDYSYVELALDGVPMLRLLPTARGFIESSQGVLTPESTDFHVGLSFRKGDYFPY